MGMWNFRDWPKLDLDKPASFTPWCTRFRRWVNDDRECMERLLKYLEREVDPIDLSREEQVKESACLPSHWDGHQVSKALADAMVSTGTESVAARLQEFGDSCGFELYRWTHARHRGAGPEQGQALYRAVTRPTWCKSTVELRESMAQMFRDIRECEAHGPDFAVGVTQRILALEQRLPHELLHELQNQMYDS